MSKGRPNNVNELHKRGYCGRKEVSKELMNNSPLLLC